MTNEPQCPRGLVSLKASVGHTELNRPQALLGTSRCSRKGHAGPRGSHHVSPHRAWPYGPSPATREAGATGGQGILVPSSRATTWHLRKPKLQPFEGMGIAAAGSTQPPASHGGHPRGWPRDLPGSVTVPLSCILPRPSLLPQTGDNYRRAVGRVPLLGTMPRPAGCTGSGEGERRRSVPCRHPRSERGLARTVAVGASMSFG